MSLARVVPCTNVIYNRSISTLERVVAVVLGPSKECLGGYMFRWFNSVFTTNSCHGACAVRTRCNYSHMSATTFSCGANIALDFC